MGLRFAIDPETGVQTISSIITPGEGEKLAAENRERNRLHIAAMEADRIRAAAAPRPTAEEERAAFLRQGSMSPPEAPPSKVPARRADLASLLQGLAAATAAQRTLTDQVDAAVSHQREAKARLAAASVMVDEAKAVAARATAEWLAGDHASARPDTSAVANAMAALALAAADAEAIDGAVAVLRGDLAAAEKVAANAFKAAQDAEHAVASARAVDLAYRYAALEAEMVHLRWQLIGFSRSKRVNAQTPSIVQSMFGHQAFHTDTHRHSNPVGKAYENLWSEWRKSLMIDASAEILPE